MTTTGTSTAIVAADPAFSDPERFALAGFLAGYRGLTRDAFALDLRQFAAWCDHHNLRLFQVRRADIVCFGRDLEAAGRSRGHRGPPALHRGRVLPLRRRGRTARPLARGPRPPGRGGI
ncbi:MAG: hypothetical protein QOG97_524 [Acidimicrobiaceae bacterium]|jgi:hypothetical protein|nr:hypothetical protein [Acidimicrobiaceae bacterium]